MDRSSQRLLLFTIMACVIAIYVFPLALPTPLMDPDEGIHATIAQEMVERGDYLVPRFLGEPFRDKPILFSAAQAASLRVFGMNEAAVRLPGFVFALFGCITTAILARRLFDPQTAIFALLAALTLAVPAILAQSPAHDIALVPWINLLVLSFWEQEHAGNAKQRWRWVAVMSVCVALALLTKGLIGIAVVSTGIGLYVLLSRSLSRGLVTRFAVAFAAGGLLASPWFLIMERASPGYLYYYFVERHLLGFVTEGQIHGLTPWYYYLAPVFGGAMPWIFFAAAVVLQRRYDAPRSRNPATLLLVCWFVGGFLFLSAAGSKLVTYSLPLFPPIAILSGNAFWRFFQHNLSSMVRQIFVATFRLVTVVGVIVPVGLLLTLHHFLNVPSPAAAYIVAILASAAMGVGLLMFEQGRGPASIAIGALWFPLVFISVMPWSTQSVAELHSQRLLVDKIREHGPMPQNMVLVGERVGSFMFYLSPAERSAFRAGKVCEVPRIELDGLIPPAAGTAVAVTGKELKGANCEDAIHRLTPFLAGDYYVIMPTKEDPRIAARPEEGKQ